MVANSLFFNTVRILVSVSSKNKYCILLVFSAYKKESRDVRLLNL